MISVDIVLMQSNHLCIIHAVILTRLSKQSIFAPLLFYILRKITDRNCFYDPRNGCCMTVMNAQ